MLFLEYLPVIAVSSDRVYETGTEVNLIVFYIWTWDIEDYFIILIPDAHVAAQLARIIAHARRGKMDAC